MKHQLVKTILKYLLVGLLISISNCKDGGIKQPPNCFNNVKQRASKSDCINLLRNLENSVSSSTGNNFYSPTDGKTGKPAGCNQISSNGNCALSICRTPDTSQDVNGVIIVPGPPSSKSPNTTNPNIKSLYALDIADYLLSRCADVSSTGGKITTMITNTFNNKENEVDVQLSVIGYTGRKLMYFDTQENNISEKPSTRQLMEESDSPVAYIDNGYYCIKRSDNNVFLRRESLFENAQDRDMNSDNVHIERIIDEMTTDIENIVGTHNPTANYVEHTDGDYEGHFSVFNQGNQENQFINLNRQTGSSTIYEQLLADAEAAMANEVVGLPPTNNLRFMAFGIYLAPNRLERPGYRQSTLIGTLLFNRK